MKKKSSTFVVSAFIGKDNKYLLVFDPRFEFWRVPGGRVQFGEDAEEALKREIEEELNIKIEINNFLGFGQDVVTLVEKQIKASRLLLYFECEIAEGEIKRQTSEEISEMKWLELEKIKEHSNLEPGINNLFERFHYK